jgi:hypothetical protein
VTSERTGSEHQATQSVTESGQPPRSQAAARDAERTDVHVSGGDTTREATEAGRRAEGESPASAEDATAASGGEGNSPCLVAAERARAYRERWNELKGEFVDDPRHALRRIDGLVGEVLDEIEQMLGRQRAELESAMGDERASTEDLRVAFGRYREFFDRMLSV